MFQLSDDKSWAKYALSAIISLCRVRTVTDLTLYRNTTGQLRPDLSVIDMMCFSHCSKRGVCDQGREVLMLVNIYFTFI